MSKSSFFEALMICSLLAIQSLFRYFSNINVDDLNRISLNLTFGAHSTLWHTTFGAHSNFGSNLTFGSHKTFFESQMTFGSNSTFRTNLWKKPSYMRRFRRRVHSGSWQGSGSLNRCWSGSGSWHGSGSNGLNFTRRRI